MKKYSSVSVILSCVALALFVSFAILSIFELFLRVVALVFAIVAVLTIVIAARGEKRTKALSIVVAIIEIIIGIFGLMFTLNYVPGAFLCLLGIITILNKKFTSKPIICLLVAGIVISFGVYGAVIIQANSALVYIGHDAWGLTVSNAIGECILANICLLLVWATALTPSSWQAKTNARAISEPKGHPCPMCGKTIPADCTACNYCGYDNKASSARPTHHKSASAPTLNQIPVNQQPVCALSNHESNEQEMAPNIGIPRHIRFCRRCGFELIENSKFCSRCGNEIEKGNIL